MTRHSNLLTPISLKELQNNSWNFQPKYSLDMLDTLPISHQAMIKYEHCRIIKHLLTRRLQSGEQMVDIVMISSVVLAFGI